MSCCSRKYLLNAYVALVSLFFTFQKVYAEVPTIACPNYFRYFSDGVNFFGKITLPNVIEGNTKLEINFSQRGTIPERNPSSLSLFESQQDTVDNFLNGKPITYRVDFPVRNVLPKLTLLSVNDVVICSDRDYPAPSTSLKLIHNLALEIKNTITPFVVRDNGLGARMTNSFDTHNMAKPAAISKREYQHNPFLRNPATNSQPFPSADGAKNTHFNTKPEYMGNPFLSNVLQKRPGSNTNFSSKSQYSGNPFLTELPKNRLSSMTSNTPTVSTQNTGLLNEVCGLDNSSMTPFIRGGKAVNRGEFPWLTAIYSKKGADLKFICAGSLISARTVISAAHCFVEHKLQANRTLVLLGRNNLELVQEDGSEHLALESLILHPEYNSNAISDADIALLHLRSPVTFTRYIKPICLWSGAPEVNNIVGSTAFVAGWGADQNGELVIEQPKKIETRIATDSECKRSLQDYQTIVSNRTICVSTSDSVGPCTGDSGGGLAMYTNGRWTLRGIVSAGLTRHGKCFSHDYYYFCDIAKHMNWIQTNMLT